jgi:hypothetical protein
MFPFGVFGAIVQLLHNFNAKLLRHLGKQSTGASIPMEQWFVPFILWYIVV